jgi:hypothetical protein
MHVGEPILETKTTCGITITPHKAHNVTEQLTKVLEKL